jgi:hypothetical protein
MNALTDNRPNGTAQAGLRWSDLTVIIKRQLAASVEHAVPGEDREPRLDNFSF